MKNIADSGDRLLVTYGNGHTAIFDVVHRSKIFNDIIQIQLREIIPPSGDHKFTVNEVIYRWTAGSKFPKGWEILRARFNPKDIPCAVTRRIVALQIWEGDNCLGNLSSSDVNNVPRMNVDGFKYLEEWLCQFYSRDMA